MAIFSKREKKIITCGNTNKTEKRRIKELISWIMKKIILFSYCGKDNKKIAVVINKKDHKRNTLLLLRRRINLGAKKKIKKILNFEKKINDKYFQPFLLTPIRP